MSSPLALRLVAAVLSELQQRPDFFEWFMLLEDADRGALESDLRAVADATLRQAVTAHAFCALCGSAR